MSTILTTSELIACHIISRVRLRQGDMLGKAPPGATDARLQSESHRDMQTKTNQHVP